MAKVRREVYRSAVTGQFVSKAKAARSPRSTVRQRFTVTTTGTRTRTRARSRTR